MKLSTNQKSTFYKSISQLMKQAREEAGLTTDEAARAIGCKPKTLERWEDGTNLCLHRKNLGNMLSIFSIYNKFLTLEMIELPPEEKIPSEQKLAKWSNDELAEILAARLKQATITN